MVHHDIDNIKKTFQISKEHGFLPEQEPLKELPIKYKSLDYIANNLPTLIKNGELKQYVDNLELNDIDELSQEQVQRLYTILSLIIHAYIWNPLSTATFIPKQLAIPWHSSAAKLGIAPVLTHAAVDLYNWKLVGSSFILDNLESINTMTGTVDEQWFYLIMTDIERQGGAIINALLDIINNIEDNDVDKVIFNMNIIKNTINNMSKTVNRMKEKCNPDTFFDVLRPYLGGWSSKDDKVPFYDGIIYEGVSTEKIKYVGGSAAQSSLIPCIDSVLNINHEDTFFQSMRQYMPKPHADFIEFLKNNLNLIEFINNSNNNELVMLHNDCVRYLVKFRRAHYGLADKYIIQMVAKRSKNSVIRGSGDTELEKFLQKAIDETIVNK